MQKRKRFAVNLCVLLGTLGLFSTILVMGSSTSLWAKSPTSRKTKPTKARSTPKASAKVKNAKKKKVPTGKWKIRDVVNQESAYGFRFSPDGRKVLWTKRVPDSKKDRHVSRLYLSFLGKKISTLQLLRGKASARAAKWSPSGKKMSFLSSRKGPKKTKGAQIWLMDVRGGEPWQLTSFPLGIRQYEWLDDGHLIILARERRTLREKNKKKRKDSSYVVEEQKHMTPYRIFLYTVKSGKTKRLTHNRDQITYFALSPDKKWFLTKHFHKLTYPVDGRGKHKFFLHNRKKKSVVRVMTKMPYPPRSIYWQADSKGWYATATHTSDIVNEGAGASFLYEVSVQTHRWKRIPLSWKWGLLFLGFSVRPDGFVANLANGAVPKWRYYRKTGGKYTFTDLQVKRKSKKRAHLFRLSLHKKSNQVIYMLSSASQVSQWHYGHLKKSTVVPKKPWIRLNAHLKNKYKAKTEVWTWKGALNETVEGILYYPRDYKPGKRYPLVLMIHGGPMGIDMDAFSESWAYYPNLMAQKGAFVLFPNYHGSTGYGQKFAESIKGRYYELEIPDMLKGIDALDKRGMIDPKRVGALGWSNGGILTIGLSVWSKRLKVAGVGAADVNWTSDYGRCSFGPSFDNYYFTGPPWKKLAHYIKKSPLFHAEKVKVPTIIFHGANDTVVPFSQGWEYYRALQQIKKAPVRFLVFPSTGHSLWKLTHKTRKMKEEIAWFDRYLFKTHKPKNEALKKGSPLARLLKQKKMARVGHRFGKLLHGVLIPELVKVGKLQVGRFEVTRAQWAGFSPTYRFALGTGNFPASGISFKQARAYVQWLARFTGKPYRLPTPKEAKALAKKASGGNTLDYWAGYTVGPDDQRRLQPMLKKLKPGALLKSVDSFRGTKKEGLYGSGGHVAEWSQSLPGKGKVVGKSAVSPSSSQGHTTDHLGYIGLRVVIGKIQATKPTKKAQSKKNKPTSKNNKPASKK